MSKAKAEALRVYSIEFLTTPVLKYTTYKKPVRVVCVTSPGFQFFSYSWLNLTKSVFDSGGQHNEPTILRSDQYSGYTVRSDANHGPYKAKQVILIYV